MSRHINTGLIASALLLAWVGVALAITCEECREIEKQKAALNREVNTKSKQLQQASEKGRFNEVTDLRRQVMQLRKDLMEFEKKEAPCADACRPDVVKGAECTELRTQILNMEELASDSDLEKLDNLYRSLARCNKELAQLKKTSK